VFRRLGLLLAGTVAALLLLGACSSGDDDTATATATMTATEEPTGTATMEATETATMEATGTATMEATAEPMADTVSVASTDLGDVLVGANGHTLYLFQNDEAGVSNCADGCAQAWPPLTVEAGEDPAASADVTGTLGTIERDDGSLQVTIDDVPLYYYAADSAAGDTTGQGVGNNWYVVAPDGTAIES
jgi:predicted lipoprotein with Yx(FWY)xxD motif